VKRAVILAGGKGTRLRPYTVALPKPLMPVSEYPILEIIIRQLAKAGFTHVTLAVNHQADIIKAYFGDGSKLGICIDYSLETIPLSTMGPLKLMKDLPDNFLIMNGDVLSDINYGDFIDTHIKNGRTFSILAHKRIDKVDYGVLDINNNSELVSFREKPINSYLVSMGIYVASKSILNHIPANKAFGFDDLMYAFLNEKIKVDVIPYDGYWMDIGRPDDYLQATNDFDELRKKIGV
jgi:NDP-sugar pyrophosphorylase family protein